MNNLHKKRTLIKSWQRGSILVSLLLCFSITSCVSDIDLKDLKLVYQNLLDSQSFCQHKRQIIFSDKPVYKVGEVVYFTVYYYNLLSKRPLIHCKDNIYNSVTIYDINGKFIASFEADVQKQNPNQEKVEIGDYSVFYYSYEIPKDFAGGPYIAKISGNGGDEAKFIVMTFANRQVAVVGDWSSDMARPGDLLKGKLTLKLLTSEIGSIGSSQITYKWYNSETKELSSFSDTMFDGSYQINFKVPDFTDMISFVAEVTADNYNTQYKKEFLAPKFDEIVVDFTIATGKLVKNMLNKIYFQVFSNTKRESPLNITTARVVKTINSHVSVVIPALSTDSFGKGLFEINIVENDINAKAQFALEIKHDENHTIKYQIVNLEKAQFSPVHLQYEKLYFESGSTIVLRIASFNFDGRLNLILQNKSSILAQRLSYFRKAKNSLSQQKQVVKINLKELEVRQGGVFTIQLYAESFESSNPDRKNLEDMAQLKKAFNDNEFVGKRKVIRPPNIPVNPSEKIINFKGTILQEIDIFVEPENILGAEIQLDKVSYLPGEKIEFGVFNRFKCGKCLKGQLRDLQAILLVTDESAFLEIEKSSESSSMLTKLFLQKEILPSSKSVKYNNKYIDHIFNPQVKLGKDELIRRQRNVEYILGNASSRKFLFDPLFLEKYIQQPYDESFNETRNLYEYLVPSNSPGFVQPVTYCGGNILFKNAPCVRRIEPLQENVIDANEAGPIVNDKVEQPPNVANDHNSLPKEEEEVLKRDTIYHDFKFMKKNGIFGEFVLPERITNFLFRVVLYTSQGVYGHAEKSIQVRKPINVSADIPLFIYKDEEFKIPIIIENNLSKATEITIVKPTKSVKSINAHGTITEIFTINKGNLPMVIEINDQDGKPVASYKIDPQLVNPGILALDGASEFIEINSKTPTNLNFVSAFNSQLVPGNNKLEVCYRNGILALIIDTIKEFNRIPTGCFEQASTTTFPIIIALKVLKYLPETAEIKALINELIENLKKGIKLLLTYECKSGGFEWFGSDPGHSTLTAYGLWQFLEIATIDPQLFDSELLKRLENFLETQKDQKGGFFIRQGLDALGNPEKMVSDIYVLFALSKGLGDIRKLFNLEYEYMLGVYKEFKENKRNLDSYKLAVIGQLFLNTNNKELSYEILGTLASRQNDSGEVQQSETSITRSSGESLAVETTSLSLILALSVEGSDFRSMVDKGLKFIAENLKKVYYQSTQATILSLLAIELYLSKNSNPTSSDISFEIRLNEQKIDKIDVGAANALQKSICVDLNPSLAKLETLNKDLTVSVVGPSTSGNSSGRYFFEIRYEYYSIVPHSNPKSVINAQISKKIQDNISVYTIKIINLVDKEQGMVNVEFNRPSCYDFNINDIESLRQRGDFDFYELKDNNRIIVFYFRGMKPLETKSFNISLVKRFALTTCSERAHLVYLYYDKEGSILYRKA